MSNEGTDLVRPLVIVQFSDLHFGQHSRYAPLEESRLKRLAEDCATSIRQGCKDLGWQEHASLVCVTGDIAEAARPREFVAATTFFRSLAHSLELPSSSFVFIPGNHDVSWTACKQVESEISDGEIEPEQRRTRVDAIKLDRYERFVAQFYDPQSTEKLRSLGAGVAHRTLVSIPVEQRRSNGKPAFVCHAYVHDFGDLGISVAALNSCELESNANEDHRGHLSDIQIQAVLDHWLSPTTPTDRIRMILVHHNPVSTVPDNVRRSIVMLEAAFNEGKLRKDDFAPFVSDLVGFEGRERLKRLATQTQTSLILHGHHHASETDNAWAWRGRNSPSGNTYVFSAGSWGLTGQHVPAHEPSAIQLLRIDPIELTLQVGTLRYEPRANTLGRSELGAFVTDELSRGSAASPLSIPSALRGRRSAASPATIRIWADTAPAVLTYRRHKRDSFKRWDLRGTGGPAVANNAPVDATLDDMYVQLAFSDERGETWSLTPDEIISSVHSSIVLGTAGAGKTTWMRWTFRRLIERDKLSAVPFFLELRNIARLWKDTPFDEQTILSCVVHELKICNVPDAGRVAMTLLENNIEPVPILLVDGWDELGELGHRFRERLAEFRTAYPRAKIIVTSRPYGSSRPMGSDGFETLEVMPLREEDIDALALRFHIFVHGEESKTARESADVFMQALQAAPDAHDLAETALLLTMMLILAREGPLPDRRHRLYDKCLRNLLTAHPDLGAREGVELENGQWRPADSEERIRVVAGLAYSMQASGYRGGRAQLSLTREDAMALLPTSWDEQSKDGFLSWLIGRAGVLVDRIDSDDEDDAMVVFVSFAHLSFQEHLAAFHLAISADGSEERVKLLEPFVSHPGWWETLRLWAGLIHDRQPRQLSMVLEHFTEHTASLWLRGAILADGNGQKGTFDAWVTNVATARDLSSDLAVACAEAWAASRQAPRRMELEAAFLTSAPTLEWMQRARLARWAKLAALRSPSLGTSLSDSMSPAALCEMKAMFGVSVWFPKGPAALLRLWPSQRVSIGSTLQICATLGASREHLSSVMKAISKRTSPDVDDYSLYVDALSADFQGAAMDEVAADFCRDAAREVIRCFGLSHVQRGLDRGLIAGVVIDILDYLAPSLLKSDALTMEPAERFVCNLVDETLLRLDRTPFGQVHTALLGAKAGHDEELFRNCVRTDLAALGARCAVRIAFAYAALEPPFSGPTFTLLQQACRVSLRPRDRRQRRKLTLELQKTQDPVWSAFARRIARTATPDDVKLLASVARGDCPWADPHAVHLGPIVRGDISLNGKVVTLETVCDWAGVRPPPHLEPFSLDEEEEESPDSAPSAWG